jgi:hypothetical protein
MKDDLFSAAEAVGLQSNGELTSLPLTNAIFSGNKKDNND